jgi:6-phosphogluconolactonase
VHEVDEFEGKPGGAAAYVVGDRWPAPRSQRSTAGRFAFVCDVGLDKVMAYRFDAQQGKLTPADPAFAKTT